MLVISNNSMASKNSKMIVAGAVVTLVIAVIAAGIALNPGGTKSTTSTSTSGTTTVLHAVNFTTAATTIVDQTKHNATTAATTIPQLSYDVNSAYNSTVGDYLSNATGWALYTYAKDTPYSGNSTCYGGCAAIWPPFYVANVTPPQNINASKFGSIARVGGGRQTTYNGMPLYFYSGDKHALTVNGQGIGGVWYVVRVNGTGG